MVEILRAPSLGQNMSGTDDITEMSNRFANQNAAQEQQRGSPHEANLKNAGGHTPRRAFTSADYQLPVAPGSPALHLQRRLNTPSATSPRDSAHGHGPGHVDSYFQLQRQPPVPSIPATPTTNSQHLSPVSPFVKVAGHLRPSLPSPQRSYSLMDVEPVPFTHQPGVTLTLPFLPPEIHYAIFDFLDPIDSTCLGLTSKHFYAIHYQMHGKISLAARREGPNDMEWVWRNAGPFLQSAQSGQGKQNSLAMLSPRGMVYCRKCRTARCELHNHIQEWMGPGLEYCEVAEKFGRPALEGARRYCYRSSPRHPHRCGRHTRQQRTVRLV